MESLQSCSPVVREPYLLIQMVLPLAQLAHATAASVNPCCPLHKPSQHKNNKQNNNNSNHEVSEGSSMELSCSGIPFILISFV